MSCRTILNRKKPKNQLNHYSGSEWAKASLSVHKFEGPIPAKRKEHGAAFPFRLAKHFVSTYSKENDLVFMDAEFYLNIFKDFNVNIEKIDVPRFTSNQTFILRKKSSNEG